MAAHEQAGLTMGRRHAWTQHGACSRRLAECIMGRQHCRERRTPGSHPCLRGLVMDGARRAYEDRSRCRGELCYGTRVPRLMKAVALSRALSPQHTTPPGCANSARPPRMRTGQHRCSGRHGSGMMRGARPCPFRSTYIAPIAPAHAPACSSMISGPPGCSSMKPVTS